MNCCCSMAKLLLNRSSDCTDSSRPVKLKDFGEHYRQMSADSDFRFSEEFEELKRVGREQLCTAADLPVNRPKNRFTNILPYDQSRFKLQPTDDDEGSDYINANYVTVSGLNSFLAHVGYDVKEMNNNN
jgi:protein tyrosine phosphatase